ncbi:hypothetical protein [Chlorogloeopsis sp. ULAP02]
MLSVHKFSNEFPKTKDIWVNFAITNSSYFYNGCKKLANC